MKWRWRKSDLEIGSRETLGKRTHASDRGCQDLESDSIPRVSWKLEAGAPSAPQASGIERNLVPTETIYSVALVPHRGNGHLIWLPEY